MFCLHKDEGGFRVWVMDTRAHSLVEMLGGTQVATKKVAAAWPTKKVGPAGATATRGATEGFGDGSLAGGSTGAGAAKPTTFGNRSLAGGSKWGVGAGGPDRMPAPTDIQGIQGNPGSNRLELPGIRGIQSLLKGADSGAESPCEEQAAEMAGDGSVVVAHRRHIRDAGLRRWRASTRITRGFAERRSVDARKRPSLPTPPLSPHYSSICLPLPDHRAFRDAARVRGVSSATLLRTLLRDHERLSA